MGEIIIGTMQTVCSGLLRVHTVTQTYCKTMVMMMTAVRKTMTIALMTTITMMITWLQKTLQCIEDSSMKNLQWRWRTQVFSKGQMRRRTQRLIFGASYFLLTPQCGANRHFLSKMLINSLSGLSMPCWYSPIVGLVCIHRQASV